MASRGRREQGGGPAKAACWVLLGTRSVHSPPVAECTQESSPALRQGPMQEAASSCLLVLAWLCMGCRAAHSLLGEGLPASRSKVPALSSAALGSYLPPPQPRGTRQPLCSHQRLQVTRACIRQAPSDSSTAPGLETSPAEALGEKRMRPAPNCSAPRLAPTWMETNSERTADRGTHAGLKQRGPPLQL